MCNAKFKKLLICQIAAAAMSLGAAATASADVTLSLNYEWSGGTASTGPVMVTFADIAADTVRLTIDTSAFTGPDFISGFYFNYNRTGPTLSAASLSFDGTISGSSGAIAATGILYNSTNCSSGGSCSSFKADGDGYFDFVLNYPTSGTKFTDEKKSSYIITGSGLLASMFADQSVGGPAGKTGFYAGAHVQATPGGQSGWMGATTVVTAIPEPEVYAMLGVGLGLMGWVGRRKRLKGSAAN